MSWLTTAQVALLLNCHQNKVCALIASGNLDAINIAPKGKRKTWRVRPDAVAEFGRRNAYDPPAARRRRAAVAPVNVYEFVK